MNKFKNLVSKLIGNPLWANNLTYCQVALEDQGIGEPKKKVVKNEIRMVCVIKQVAKSLVDNESIFNTDKVILIDSKTLTPSKDDFIIVDEKRHKIVAINPIRLSVRRAGGI